MTTLEHLVPAVARGALTAGALGVACAVLSVFVVARRWAFIGEGIAHAGFGGAGLAWLAALAFPSVAWLTADSGLAAQFTAVGFSAVVALLIGRLSRREGVEVDTAVGVFLVASLALGFLAYGAYYRINHHAPPQFAQYLGFEPLRAMSLTYAATAVLISAGVVTVVALLWKELLYASFDAAMAEASGVRAGLAHYALLALLWLVIVVGMRWVGTLLIVALLVLPGAAALQLARTTRGAWTAAVAIGLAGALTGPLVSLRYPELPEGPVIVLTLFALFVGSLAVNRFRRA